MRHIHLRLSVVLACAALSGPVFAGAKHAMKKIERGWRAYQSYDKAQFFPGVVVLQRTLSKEGHANGLISSLQKKGSASLFGEMKSVIDRGKPHTVGLEFTQHSGASIVIRQGRVPVERLALSFDGNGRLDRGSRSVLREVFGKELSARKVTDVKKVRKEVEKHARRRKAPPLFIAVSDGQTQSHGLTPSFWSGLLAAAFITEDKSASMSSLEDQGSGRGIEYINRILSQITQTDLRKGKTTPPGFFVDKSESTRDPSHATGGLLSVGLEKVGEIVKRWLKGKPALVILSDGPAKDGIRRQGSDNIGLFEPIDHGTTSTMDRPRSFAVNAGPETVSDLLKIGTAKINPLNETIAEGQGPDAVKKWQKTVSTGEKLDLTSLAQKNQDAD